jgi:hypothetical protein
MWWLLQTLTTGQVPVLAIFPEVAVVVVAAASWTTSIVQPDDRISFYLHVYLDPTYNCT